MKLFQIQRPGQIISANLVLQLCVPLSKLEESSYIISGCSHPLIIVPGILELHEAFNYTVFLRLLSFILLVMNIHLDLHTLY